MVQMSKNVTKEARPTLTSTFSMSQYVTPPALPVM